jgi:hypothetical protein
MEIVEIKVKIYLNKELIIFVPKSSSSNREKGDTFIIEVLVERRISDKTQCGNYHDR